MALRLTSGWNHTVIGSGSLAFDAGGAKTATVSSTTAIHGTFDLSSLIGTGLYTGFSAKLKTQMDTAGGGPYTITYTPSTTSYKLSRTGGSWTITSGTNTVMRNILGTGATFPISSVNNGGVHEIDLNPAVTATAVRPYYVIVGTLGAASDDTDDYEPDEIASVGETDDGSSYSVHRTEAATYRDFSVQFEPQAAMFSRFAASAVPFTWQHFFAHARATEPFIVSDDIEQTAYKLRGESVKFRPLRVVPDWNEYFHVRLMAYVLGRI